MLIFLIFFTNNKKIVKGIMNFQAYSICQYENFKIS